MPEVTVFDTNVLFSGLGWKGKPYECLELARRGAVEGVTCQEILDELADKLQSKLDFSSDEVIESIADLLTFLRLVTISGTLKAVPDDPDDDKVLECAVAGGATHVVTGDRHHLLPLVTFQNISIVSPSDFLSLIKGASHP